MKKRKEETQAETHGKTDRETHGEKDTASETEGRRREIHKKRQSKRDTDIKRDTEE